MKTPILNVVKGFTWGAIILAIFAYATVQYFGENIAIWEQSDLKKIQDSEADYLFSYLIWNLDLAAIELGEARKQIKIVLDNEYGDDYDRLTNDLENYLEPNNYIRQTITAIVGDYKFRGIMSNSTDIIVTYGTNIVWDESEDCSLLGSYRSFQEEVPMHANPPLAEKILYQIGKGIPSSSRKPLFWQFMDHPKGENIRDKYPGIYDEFKDKKAYILESYDLHGLEKAYRKENSWEDVFRSFEFLTPVYIYDEMDIAGRPYIVNGRATGVDRLAIIAGFDLYQVILDSPEAMVALERFDEQRHDIIVFRDKVELLLTFVSFISFLVAMVSMIITVSIIGVPNYGRRITDIQPKRDSRDS